MLKRKKRLINGIIAGMTAMMFFVNTCCYAAPVRIDSQDKLAAYSVFQQSSVRDVKFLAGVFSVADHFLVDRRDDETLEKVIRDKFRNNRDILAVMDLGKVERVDDVISMRYARSDGIYSVSVCLVSGLSAADASAGEWTTAGRFAVCARMETPNLRSEITPLVGLDETSIIAVHTNSAMDVSNSVRDTHTNLLSDGRFAGAYEHIAMSPRPGREYISSYLNGTLARERVENDFNDYHIEGLRGSAFVLTGGGIGACHLDAFKQLVTDIRETGLKRTEIHLPMDAIYRKTEQWVQGDSFPVTVTLGDNVLRSAIGEYTSHLEREGVSFNVVDRRTGETVYSGGEGVLRVDIFIWGDVDSMLSTLPQRSVSLGPEPGFESAFLEADVLESVYRYAAPLLNAGRDMDLYHTESVVSFMERIARAGNMDPTTGKRLVTTAMLHDIGYAVEDEADFRSEDKRLAHMRIGEVKARDILLSVNLDLGRECFSAEDIDEVCRIISIHDNPSIRRPFAADDNMALAFRPADRLAMLEREQFGKDITRRAAKSDGVDPVENLEHVIERHTEERALYPADMEGFVGGTLYTSEDAYGVFVAEVLARAKDIRDGVYGPVDTEALARLGRLESFYGGDTSDLFSALPESRFLDREVMERLYYHAAPLLKAGKAMDLYHSVSVVNIMERIARAGDMDPATGKRLITTALLHDIGYAAEDQTNYRSEDKRVAHMRVGYAKARDILLSINRDLGREYFSADDIDEICHVISVHDNPSIKRPFDAGDTMALTFRPADRLAMLEREEFGQNIEERRAGKESGVTPVENLEHVIKRHTEERALYPADMEIFVRGTLYTSEAAYGIFAAEILARARDIRGGVYGPVDAEALVRLDSLESHYGPFAADYDGAEPGDSPEELYLKSRVSELMSSGSTLIAADSGEEFKFSFRWRDGNKDQKEFMIFATAPGGSNAAGRINVYGNCISYSFDSEYETHKYDAIEVEERFREKYRGIGSAIMSLAMGIAKANGFDEFLIQTSRADGFYEKLGFVRSSDRPRDFSYDIRTRTLPPIGITQKVTAPSPDGAPVMTFAGPVSAETLPGGELIERLRASITPRSVDKEACDRLASMGYQIATVRVADGYGGLDGIHDLMARMFDMEAAIRVQAAMSEAIFNILNYAVDKYGGAGALLAADIDGVFVLTIIDKGAGFDSDKDYNRVEGGTRRGYGLHSFRMMSSYFKHIAHPDGNTIVIARKGNKPAEDGDAPGGKGSVADGLRELYANFRNTPVSAKEFATARGYSETTVRKEFDMLETLGLIVVDKTARAYRYSLAERVRDLTQDVVDRICGLPEMDRYEIPAGRLDKLRDAIRGLILDYTAGKRVAPLVGRYKATSGKQRRALNRGERTYSEVFEKDLIPSHVRLSEELKREEKTAAIFTGVVGSASSGKTTIVNKLREAYEESGVAGGARVIFFDDWLLQKSDREVDPETEHTTEDVLKKFKVRGFVRAMKTFMTGKGAIGTELVKPVYDAEAKGQIKLGIDAYGKVIIYNGENVSATIERGKQGELIIVVSEGGEEVERGRSVKVGSILVAINEGSSESGEIEIDIRGTIHRIGAYEEEQRHVVVLEGKGERAPPMIDYETGAVLGETAGVLTARGEKWEAKEFVPYEDGVYIVEGILTLYDYDGVPKGERLSDFYDDTVFVDCDFDIRLERGILRERRRAFLEKGRDATSEETRGYIEKFMARKEIEDTLIYPAKRNVSYKVTTQTRLESLYTLYKSGELLHPANLAVLSEMGMSPYYVEEQLNTLSSEYIKERLGEFKGTLMQADEEGVSFFVVRIGNGLVVKVPHDQQVFDRSVRPFYDRLVSKVGGDLVVPGEIVNVGDLNVMCKVNGETRRLENVLVQTEVTPLRQRITRLLGNGEIARAKGILKEFFVLQQKLWRVGLVDADPVIDRYGLTIEEGRETMVMFTVNSLTNDPEAYYVRNYRTAFLESVPVELREYAARLIDEYIPTKAEFRKRHFEKQFSGASSMVGVAHPELVSRRVDYLAREVLRVKSNSLRELFNDMELADIPHEVAWTKMWLETISFSGSSAHEALKRFHGRLLEERDLVLTSSREEIRKKISAGMIAPDPSAQREVDTFLHHLYDIIDGVDRSEAGVETRGVAVSSDVEGKGSVADGLRELYKNFRNTPVSVKEFATARGYSETTVRKEFDMLEKLGLIEVDKSARAYRYSLSEDIRALAPDDIDAICGIAEMDRYEIPVDRIPLVKEKIEFISDPETRVSAENTVRDNTAAKATERMFNFPDFSGVMLGPMVESAPTIEEYYEQHKGEKSLIARFENDYGQGKVTSYFMAYGGMMPKKDPAEEYRIIRHEEVYDGEGRLRGNLLVYYDRKENAVNIRLEGERRKEPIRPGSDTERGQEGWDLATIRVYLDGYGRVSLVDHKVSQMGLSRTAIALMLRDAGIHGQLKDLYDALKGFLVLRDVDDEGWIEEEKDERIVPLKIVSRVSGAPAKATEEDIAALEDFQFYKSWTVRQLALSALGKLREHGMISTERLEKNRLLFETYHIREDLQHIERLLVEDPTLAEDVLRDVSGEAIARADVENIRVRWYGKGYNKNIFRIWFDVKGGMSFSTAVSTIRHDPIGAGYDGKSTDKVLKNWKRLSDETDVAVPRLIAHRWIFDYKPRVADRARVGATFADDQENLGKNSWIYNNVNIVFREFVEGVDLEHVLLDSDISGDEKRKMIRVALQSSVDIWNATKDEAGRGLFYGDPKPANIVISGETGAYRASNIDLDALREYEGLEALRSIINHYPEYKGFEVVDDGGQARITDTTVAIAAGSKGSVAEGLIELYTNFRNTPVSVKEFAAARGYSETTTRMELRMLEELGLVTADISGKAYMFSLKGYVRQLPRVVIERICALPEMSRYEITRGDIRFVKREIGRIVKDSGSTVQYAAEIKEGSALVIVHAGRDAPEDGEHGDTSAVIEGVARELAGSGVFDETYEIAAADYPFYADRPIGHDGHVMVQPEGRRSPRANERLARKYSRAGARAVRVQDRPDDYSYRDLRGNNFTIIGGEFHHCHFLAFAQLVKEVAEGLRQSKDRPDGPVTITIPGDAVYETYEDRFDDLYYVASRLASLTHAELGGYIDILKGTDIPFAVVMSVRGRDEVIESSGDAPGIVLRVAATSGEVIKALRARKDKGDKTAVAERALLEKMNAEMTRIHEMDIELIPPLEKGKTLWHVIPAELIPLSIRKDFIKMVGDLNRDLPEMREKIRIVTEKQDLTAVTAELAADGNNVVDVAVAGAGQLESLPEGVKALVFEGELGDFRQLEGILAALRALQQDNARALTDLYRILTGKDYTGDEADILKNIADPVALSKVIKFTLLPIRVYDYNALDAMNQRLLQLMRAA